VGIVASLGMAVAASPGGAADWVRVRSAHFDVLSDAGSRKAEQIALQFEAFRGVFATLKKAQVDPGRPIVVFAARDEDSLKKLLPGHWERKGGARPAGVFLRGQDRHFIVLRVDIEGPSAFQIVYHEYVHLLESLNLPPVPVWLDEGLAEFYETAEVSGNDVALGNIQPRQVQQLREHTIPFSEFLTADRRSALYQKDDQVHRYYAQAAVFVHFLMAGPNNKESPLAKFVQALARGDSEQEAIAHTFGDLKTLERSFDLYVHQRVFHGMRARAQIESEPRKAEPVSPGELAALEALLELRQARLGEARALAQQAVEQEPRLAAAHLAQGEVLLWQRNAAGAAAELEEATRLAPEDPWALVALAGALSELPEAQSRREQVLVRAVAAGPSVAAPHAALARLRLKQGNSGPDTVELASRAVALEPSTLGYQLLMAEVLTKAGKPEAMAFETRMATTALWDPSTLAMMTGYYVRTGRAERAEALLRKAVQSHPHSTDMLRGLSWFLDRQGRGDEGETVLREALRLDPDNPTLLNELGYRNAERGVKLDEALKLIDRALGRIPTDAAFMDSKGWALFRLGRLAEAEEWLRRALEQRDDATILEHLGDVLKARGNAAGAVEQWRLALTREPEDAEKARLEEKLRQAAPVAATEAADKP
jgi:tetratricopeptide (TPR) repeat protein